MTGDRAYFELVTKEARLHASLPGVALVLEEAHRLPVDGLLKAADALRRLGRPG